MKEKKSDFTPIDDPPEYNSITCIWFLYCLIVSLFSCCLICSVFLGQGSIFSATAQGFGNFYIHGFVFLGVYPHLFEVDVIVCLW